MITLIKIKNIIAKEGREILEIPFKEGMTLFDIVREYRDWKTYSKIIHNSNVYEIDKISEKFLNTQKLKEKDIIILVVEVKDPVSISAIIGTILVGAEIGTFWAVVGWVLIGASMLYGFLNKPKQPSFGDRGGGSFESSPTYGWDGIQSTKDVGIPIAVIYGEHRTGINVVNTYVEEGENQTLNVLGAIGEGEIESISNVEVNGNPIENYYDEEENAEITTRMGTNNQTFIEEFGDIHTVFNQSVQLTKNSSYEYTTDGSSVQGFKLGLNVNSLYQTNKNTGSINSWSVTYKVEYKVHGDPDYISLGQHKITAKSRSDVRRFFKSPYLTAEQYDIRITRVSDDSDFYHQGDLYLTSVDEIQNHKLVYPNTALIGIRMLATEHLSGSMPNITVLVRGIKVSIPFVVDSNGNEVAWDDYYWDEDNTEWRKFCDDSSLTWDGTTYVDRWCANPVWCMKDLITNNRYGLGDYISSSHISDATFLEMARTCDARVKDGDDNWEKRFRLDIVIDSKSRAIDLLNQILTTFRAVPVYSEGAVRIEIEKSEIASHIFNMGNIIKDSFSVHYLAKDEIPNVIEFQFANKNKNYERDVIQIYDEDSLAAGDEIVKRTMSYFGVTRVSQLIRDGTFLINRAKNNTKVCKFRTTIAALGCQVMDVVKVQHDQTQWAVGGKVTSGSTTSKVCLDKEVTLTEGNSYQLIVKDADDDTIETKDISDGAGTYSEVNLSSPLSFTPASYDEYILQETDDTPELMRIASLKRLEKGEIEVETIEYTDSIYDDLTEITLPEDDYDYVNLQIPEVQDVALSERILTKEDGTVESAIDVSFRYPDAQQRWQKKIVGVKVYLSDDGGNSYEYKKSTNKAFTTIIDNLQTGIEYTVALVSICDSGEEGVIATSPSATITLDGKTDAPPDVENFAYDFTNELVFTWNEVDADDTKAYEIRTADSNWGTENSDFVCKVRDLTFTVVYPGSRSPGTYYIKAVNSSGIYSDKAVSVTPTNAAPSAPTVSKTELFQKVALQWDDVTDRDLQHYEVWSSTTDAWGGEEELVTKVAAGAYVGDVGVMAFVNVPNDPTYFKVRGVDTYGPGSFSTSVEVDQVLITDGDITANTITAASIAANTITANELAANCITANKIAANSVSADKIISGTLSAVELILGSGGIFKSSNYEKGVAGFKLDATDGLEINDGYVNADIVLVAGARLRDQFDVTEQSKVEDEDAGEWNQGTKTNVSVTNGDLHLTAGQTSGDFVSQIIDLGSEDVELGTIQWGENLPNPSLDLVTNFGSFSSYTSGGGGATNNGSESNLGDGNDSSYVGWGDGTDFWGENPIAEVDLGEAKWVNKYVYKGKHAEDQWKIQYSDIGGKDAGDWADAISWQSSNDTSGTFTPIKHRYWRWIGKPYSQGDDNQAPATLELYAYAENADITVQVRTDDDSDMSSPTDWSDEYTNPVGSNIDIDSHRYIQYKINFSTDNASDMFPSLSSVTINYDDVIIKNSDKLDGYDADHFLEDANDVIEQSHIADSAVGQAQLKTSLGTVSYNNIISAQTMAASIAGIYSVGGWAERYSGSNYLAKITLSLKGFDDESMYSDLLTLPGGSYGFYPTIKVVNNGGYDNTAYARQYYVTSSGKDHWIFLKIAKKDLHDGHKKGDIISAYEAPDHPSANYAEVTEIEIPHPFGNYNPDEHEIVIVDNENLEEMIHERNNRIKNKERGVDLLQVINQDFVVDDTKRPKYEPREIIKIDEFEAIEGETIKTMKTPDWAKVLITSEEIALKRRVVEKLPENILFKKLSRR